jgi:ABC-type phosphate transport system substrate-binding protein
MATRFLIRYASGLLLLALCAPPAQAELVVIVAADSSVSYLSQEQVINIFMGRYRKLPDGRLAQPLDIGGEAPERRDFYKKLLDKNLAEINAYWARLVFSGRTMPPKAVLNQVEVLQKVARDPSAIGYVERISLNSQVRVVYALPEDRPPAADAF